MVGSNPVSNAGGSHPSVAEQHLKKKLLFISRKKRNYYLSQEKKK
jgi:hypothetical protein